MLKYLEQTQSQNQSKGLKTVYFANFLRLKNDQNWINNNNKYQAHICFCLTIHSYLINSYKLILGARNQIRTKIFKFCTASVREN